MRACTREICWDGPPTVAPASAGTGLTAGVPPSLGASLVAFADSDRIAFAHRAAADTMGRAGSDGYCLPTVVHAWAVLLRQALTSLRLTGPLLSGPQPSAPQLSGPQRITAACPTAWGARPLAALRAAAGRCGATIEFDTLAVRAATAEPATGYEQRVLVIEFDSMSTTATVVARTPYSARIERCEYEPRGGATESFQRGATESFQRGATESFQRGATESFQRGATESFQRTAADRLAALLERAVGDCPPTRTIVLGERQAVPLRTLRALLTTGRRPTDIRWLEDSRLSRDPGA
ncbi:hypothetical protein FOH10_26380 [Nocardia otitidiscaviarum]|uniref:Hsp70 family protein n=1 Tax=Nocardia otitidiscaviarum TaxID=1823 RepID=A0A516NS84_9NOCA|nr:hypothetical protein [Nocardia otitidiscaviarum]MCP9620955.1 hypothetical protein [Nocardia otitidiscaviarum]QDP81724.1 hypothetical protein FOH10_26380 [Nocardia otitidiscaviarum]